MTDFEIRFNDAKSLIPSLEIDHREGHLQPFQVEADGIRERFFKYHEEVEAYLDGIVVGYNATRTGGEG